nr:TetR/AcrR family transcriptional regulator [uncultured Gellertiella sp.]
MNESDTPSGPPRRQRRKEARPGEIIAAGLEEFASRGFAAARLEDVARRAGIAKGTIYRYFEDKESLFLATVKARIEPALSGIELMSLDFPGSTRDLLCAVFTMMHQRLNRPEVGTLFRILIAEGSQFPALTELYHQQIISRGRDLLARIVERGVARGEIRKGPAADLPVILIAPALMSIIWKILFERHDPIDPKAFLEAHVDLVLNGLCTQNAASGA